MRPEPLVSVIVPVYNTAEYLRDCVDSVLAQTYGRLELVLVDDGSTDASGELCDAYRESDARARVLHQPNAGLSDARNAGVAESTGSFVMFLDSDDWLDSECLAVLLDLVVESGAQLAACGTVRVSAPADVHPDLTLQEPVQLSGDDFLCRGLMLHPVHAVSAWAKLVDRHLLDGGSFPPGRLHEDVFTTHKWLHRASRVAVTARILHYYRERPGSITSGPMSLKSAADKARAHLERAKDLSAYGLVDIALLEFNRGVAWHLRSRVLSGPQPRQDQGLAREVSEQEGLIRRLGATLPLGLRRRVAMAVFGMAPQSSARAYAWAMRSVKGRAGVHAIEGEGR